MNKKLFLNSDQDPKRCQEYKRGKLDNRPKDSKYYFIEGTQVTGKNVLEMIERKNITEFDISALAENHKSAVLSFLEKHGKKKTFTVAGTTVTVTQKVQEAA